MYGEIESSARNRLKTVNCFTFESGLFTLEKSPLNQNALESERRKINEESFKEISSIHTPSDYDHIDASCGICGR